MALRERPKVPGRVERTEPEVVRCPCVNALNKRKAWFGKLWKRSGGVNTLVRPTVGGSPRLPRRGRSWKVSREGRRGGQRVDGGDTHGKHGEEGTRRAAEVTVSLKLIEATYKT